MGDMSEKHKIKSQEKAVPTDAIFRIGKLVTSGVAKIVDIFFPAGKG